MFVLFWGVTIVYRWTGFLAFRKKYLVCIYSTLKMIGYKFFFETFETRPIFTLFQGYYIRIGIFKVLLIWKYCVSCLSHLNYSERPLLIFYSECMFIFFSPVFGTEDKQRKPPSLLVCHSVHISVMPYFQFSTFNTFNSELNSIYHFLALL
jgi:hypothetical protein